MNQEEYIEFEKNDVAVSVHVRSTEIGDRVAADGMHVFVGYTSEKRGGLYQ